MVRLEVSRIANASNLTATTSYAVVADYNQVQSVTAVWTATLASFTLALQYSNDNSNWFNFTAATAISNASGSVAWDVVGTKDALYWRVIATATSGTLTTLVADVASIRR